MGPQAENSLKPHQCLAVTHWKGRLALVGLLHAVTAGGRETPRDRNPDTVFRCTQVAFANDVDHEPLTPVSVDRGREDDPSDRSHDASLAIRLDRGPEAGCAHLALGNLARAHLERGTVQGVPHVVGQGNLGANQTVDHRKPLIAAAYCLPSADL